MVIPSEHRMTATQVDELLKDVVFPSNVEIRIENIAESPVADNYNV
jgi:chromosomal replication initiation ATPase DnaA